MIILFLVLLLEPTSVAYAADGSDGAAETVKTIGAVIAALVALIGAPTAFLTFKKTQAEIRKLELEARHLESAGGDDNARIGDRGAHTVAITDSNHVNVQILADPRFLGPLLLLLDFIVAWVVLTFAGYAASVLDLGYLDDLFVALLGIGLLFPILREARRVKRQLRSEPETEP